MSRDLQRVIEIESDDDDDGDDDSASVTHSSALCQRIERRAAYSMAILSLKLIYKYRGQLRQEGLRNAKQHQYFTK